MMHFLVSESYFISDFPKVHKSLASFTNHLIQWHLSVSAQNHRSHQRDRRQRGHSVITAGISVLKKCKI